jgi:hypothetical protein
MEKTETIRTATYNDIWIDEFGNVRLDNEFNLVIGKVTKEYRFLPQGITLEQGLSSEILDIVVSLIRKQAGIGKKKAEPIEEGSEQ